MTKPSDKADYSPEETARRRDATLKQMLKTPHRNQKDEPSRKKGSSKGQSTPGKRGS